MLPNIGLSGSASSGAQVGAGDFSFTGGGTGAGAGKYGWVMWIALAFAGIVIAAVWFKKGS